ncbi:BglG family transcription antiterminator [Aquibacillus rhizosphaerae]|uniref:BglG family transcription antiterminator n=1 Tax=Aquibacillus rhizosphaerae TaxID=3051431 RepID=A0ABT7L2V0_9BACI|nr:BglG family transcription antiterminator [Aquibacillus sp. LR5S19]MDL4839510.1 BglG family transcription antiterminator [Aquibacillus sp. LR5S19]
MNSRLMQILKELIASENALTSEYLANVVQVTSRTIRDDIKGLVYLLESNGAVISSIKGKGYQLQINDNQKFRSYLQQFIQDELDQEFVPDLPEERIKYLIKRLLLADAYLKLDDLSDEMHVSKSTIQNDLRQVKKILERYSIGMERRPNYGFKVKGSEVKLRFAISEYVFDRNERVANSSWNDQLSSLTQEKNLDVIWTIILEQIKENNITLSDIAINNLFIHIAIAYKRIKSGHHVSLYNKEQKEIMKQKEYQVAQEIVKKTEQVLEVSFPRVEIAYIAIHLLGTKLVSQTNISEQEIANVMEGEVYQLTISVLETIEKKMKLGIRHDRELIIGLGLHFKPAMNRYRYGMNVRNPMIDAIKSNYPLAFEAGIVAGMVLENHMGATIDENEIGYLALHIGAAMERRKLETGPKRCMIVCASGLGSAQLIKYKLQSKFGSKLEVIGTTEYYKLDQIAFDKTDFIVSSVPITKSLPVQVIEVNTILGDKDLENIESFVLNNGTSVFEYIKKELVFLRQSFTTKEEVLNFLVDQLLIKDLVDENYLDAVNEREAVAPTAFGNFVAIPHPITAQTDRTFLTICTLEKPIFWADRQVQFICLLNVKKNSSEDLQTMYDMLGKIVDNTALVQELVKSKTYNEFINVLIN